MKNKYINCINLKMFIALVVGMSLLASCEYDEVADNTFPEQVLYLPSAINGNFTIDNVPSYYTFHPTPGTAYRFKVDLNSKKFIVPLGVYRSGIDKGDNVPGSIIVRNDTIAALLAGSKVPAGTVAIPFDKMVVPSNFEVKSGSEVETFDVSIDLDYIKSVPNAIYAFAVGIESPKVTVNPRYKTTVVIINTKFLKPTANFASKADATNTKQITFTNNSTYGISYTWDFGDNTTSTSTAPVHTYAAAGTYNVTLTTVGVTGDADKSVKTLSIVVQ